MIRNKYELRQEKKRLKQKEADLKNQIISNWREIKSSLQPKKLLSNQFNGKASSQDDSDSIFVNILSYSGALLGRKLGEKAEEKLGDFFDKKAEE